ncbi:MAG: ATP-binding cassette domain-containing protein [Acidimicrobiaceae bacterium]|nr:ATP-binding cassette domain-containing protein [Acidimicrobiaceae bacterium]
MTGSERSEVTTGSRAVGLRVEGLRVHRLGQPVVRSVDLTVTPGQVTVLLGANGAGKSTLLDGISGVVPTSAGRVLLDGADITRSSRRRRVRAGLAYVQQGRAVFPSLTVEENFLVAAGRDRLGLALEFFPELRARMSVAAELLSGGEQQMVVLGRALLRQPQVLMIDELSLGLAPAVIDRMLQAVEEMAGRGVGLLLVEQFAERALDAGDSAVVMARGEVVLRGTAAQIQRQPDRLRHAYLGDLQ